MAENRRRKESRSPSRRAKARTFETFGARGATLKPPIRKPKLQRKLELSASSTALFVFAAAAGLNSVLQITRVRSVHSKDRALDVFHRSHVHFVGENVALLDQPVQLVDELGLFHLANLLDQELSVSRRSGESERFQQGNFASAEIDLPFHPNLVTAYSSPRAEI